MGQPGRCLRRCPAHRRLQQRPRLHFQTAPPSHRTETRPAQQLVHTALFFLLPIIIIFKFTCSCSTHIPLYLASCCSEDTVREFRKKFFKDLRTIPVTS
ncbi:hypothetical protein H8957_000887 [Semnopithecus entellus]